MADTDRDALDYINRLANAAGRNVHELLEEIATTAEAALRARLATTHAEDEALIQAVVETSPAFERASSGAFPNGYDISDDVAAHNASTEALRRRLAELRARAEAAERALAECRDLVSRALRRMSRGENSMSILTQLAQEAEALKTKEPRDA